MKKLEESTKIKNEDSQLYSNAPKNLVNNDKDTENRFIKNKIDIRNNPEDSIDELTLEETFILRYSDPINSIALNDNYLLFGSMLGKVVLYNIQSKKAHNLQEIGNEAIMGCSLETKINNKKIFYVSVGDELALSLQEKNISEIKSNTIKNYYSKKAHNQFCSRAFTMLWKNKSLILYLYHATEYNEDFNSYQTSYCILTYSIKNIQKELMEEGTIDMSNYSVPLDFRYNSLLFLEHIRKDARNLCIYRFKGKESNKYIIMEMDQNFGHISFAKILNYNVVLIVRQYNLIEIYNIENEPKLITSYRNEFEINAIDFYELNNKESNEIKDNENIINVKLIGEQFYIIFIDIEQNIVELKLKDEFNNNNEKKLDIFIKINLNDVKGINEDIKNKGLFLLDFPYYIKNSSQYIALTSDQACFLFKKQKLFES